MLNKFVDEAVAIAAKKNKDAAEILLALGERAIFISLYTKTLRLKSLAWDGSEPKRGENVEDLLKDIISDGLLWLHCRERNQIKIEEPKTEMALKQKVEKENGKARAKVKEKVNEKWIEAGKLAWCEQNGLVRIKYGKHARKMTREEIDTLFEKYDPITADDLLKDLKSPNLATMMLYFFQHHPKYKDKVTLKEGKWRKKYLYKKNSSDPAKSYKIFCLKHPDFECDPDKMCTFEAVFNNDKPCDLKRKFLDAGARVECSPPRVEQTSQQIIESNGKQVQEVS